MILNIPFVETENQPNSNSNYSLYIQGVVEVRSKTIGEVKISFVLFRGY